MADAAKSVTRQVETATAVAIRKGSTVDPAHVYVDDGVSGAEFAERRRPALMRLLNALKPRPPFGALLVSDRDRIGREQIETSYILKQLIRAGVQVIECQGPDGHAITLGTPTDKDGRAGLRGRGRAGEGADAHLRRGWLGAQVGQARQMLRKLVGGRVECQPFDDARGRGYTFTATGDYARLLLAGRVGQ